MDQVSELPEVTPSPQVSELGQVTYTHRYVSLKRLTWATLAIVAVMGGLYFVVGFPPAFDTFPEKMYFHAIGIGLAALAVYLVIGAFKLERYEPALDFPMSYRAFGAVVLAAAGGLVFLRPAVSSALPHVGMLLFISAFILIGDVGGALLVELWVLPRKLAGVYRSESHNPLQYFARLFPLSRADLRSYRGMGIGYWLTLWTVFSAFVAGIIGFINLWVLELGPSIFGHYIKWLGLDRGGFLDATLDPHSHMMALAIMAGVVAIAAVRFRVLDEESKPRRAVAKAGLWIALLGVAGTTLILGAVAFFNYEPPTLLQGGPQMVNGIAGDDAVMTVIGLGAMVVVGAMVANRRLWRDGVRMLILGTWVAAVVINVLEGFYIELHEDLFSGSAAAKDASFSIAQPMTGIFLLTALSLALLLVDYYGIQGRGRRMAAWASGIGLAVALIGVTLWTFADPSKHGVPFGVYVAGTAFSYLAILLAAIAVGAVHVGRFARSFP